MYGALAEKLGAGLQNLKDGSVTRTHLHPPSLKSELWRMRSGSLEKDRC